MIPPQGNADFAAAKVLDVYRRPAAFPVVCMDETPRPARHGNRSPWRRDGRNDYEYRRCGTCNVFTEPLAGKRMTKVTERKIDWAQFLADIAGRYQDATTITLVMDNLNTPRRPLRGLPAGRGQGPVGPLRVRLHPQARQLAERGGTQRHDPPEPPHRLHRGVTPGSRRLAGDRIQAKVDWQFTTDDARVKLKRLYSTFDE